jgi:hypothetical protein
MITIRITNAQQLILEKKGWFVANVVGAVLNDVPGGDLYQPYLYQISGYETTDEAEEPAVLPVL